MRRSVCAPKKSFDQKITQRICFGYRKSFNLRKLKTKPLWICLGLPWIQYFSALSRNSSKRPCSFRPHKVCAQSFKHSSNFSFGPRKALKCLKCKSKVDNSEVWKYILISLGWILNVHMLATSPSLSAMPFRTESNSLYSLDCRKLRSRGFTSMQRVENIRWNHVKIMWKSSCLTTVFARCLCLRLTSPSWGFLLSSCLRGNDLVFIIRDLVQSMHVILSQMSHPSMGPQWDHGAEMAMSAMSRDALGTGTS